MKWSNARIATTTSIALAILVFAVLAYVRRWICDDGLIVVRVAREILEGYGPNFNFFERAEPNTSALWTWLVTFGGLVTGGSSLALTYVAVFVGGAFAVAGFALALDAARRLHRPRAETAIIVPAGAFVVLGVFPFWDFATSGLETGLAFAWVSASYWLLVTLVPEAPRRRALLTAGVVGLGPLVRPDFALITLPMLVALWLLARPQWRRALALLAAAAALPLAYTIFRAGYYGTLVPLPALAKNASDAHWSRGIQFVGRYVGKYHVWIPLSVLAVVLGVSLRRGLLTARERLLIAAPIAGGLMLVVYVARVGGDFMHGRMLLVPTWLCVLPAMVLPARKWISLAVGAIAVWALIVGIARRHLAWDDGDWHSDADERQKYVAFTKDEHPLDPARFYGGRSFVRTIDDALASNSAPILVWDANGSFTLLDPGINARIALVAGRLGTAAAAVPLDAIVIDMLGLANPLGARMTVTFPGRVGHEKQIPAPWVIAEYGHPDMIASLPDEARRPITAAQHAMQCGELAELLASVREPMSASRFWKNLVGAWGRTRLVVPAAPLDAERRFCGTR